MAANLLLVLFFCFFYSFASTAQEDGETPLIPHIKANEETAPTGLNDPFQPKVLPQKITKPEEKSFPVEAVAENTPSPTSPTQTIGVDEFGPTLDSPKNKAPDETESNINLEEKINTENSNYDPIEEDLLKGSDEEFKPAPLKIGSEIPDEKELNTTTQDVTTSPIPTSTPTTTSDETANIGQKIDNSQIEKENKNEDSPPTIPKPSPKTTIQTQEQINPSELVTEEIDPWDDPRKNVSTTCRLHLERIKKKKRALSKAEATQFRVQDALKGQVKGDREALKSVNLKLENSISNLKKELSSLKEKTIRLGCPGVEI